MEKSNASLAERFLAHARAVPERRSVFCDNAAVTYEMLAAKARACACRIQSLGLRPGGMQSVGLIASNSLDFAVIVMACQLSGVPVVPLPLLISSQAQAAMIADAKVMLLFYDAEYAEQARAAASGLQAGENLTLIAIGAIDEPSTGASNTFDIWLAGTATQFKPVAIQDDWISDLIYSSGTTGTPKGIRQSYGARKAQCISLAGLGIADGTALLNTIGLYSNFGLSGLFLALWWGGTFFMMRKFSAPTAVSILANENIGMAWFAPATLIRTIDAAGFDEAIRGKLCAKLCAGAPLSEAQKKQVLDRWPGPFYEVYGQTETGTLTLHAMHASPVSKLGSVGPVLPSVSLCVIDAGDNIVPTGEAGEIVGHSTTLMSGYHQREDANASAYWKDESGRLYIRTGDIGRLDSDNYLWLCDRKKDMIISGGYNIYPADIERAFQEHPAVFEVAVVGFASMRWGETPVAFVSLREGNEANEDDLRIWLNSRVGAIQRVAAVKILISLPNGAMGKILKRELREKFADVIGILP